MRLRFSVTLSEFFEDPEITKSLENQLERDISIAGISGLQE